MNLADPDSQASSQLTYQLVTDNGAPALEMSLDPSWLDAPGRVFPVIVDPTRQRGPAGVATTRSRRAGRRRPRTTAGRRSSPSGTTTTSGSTYDDIDFLDYSALGTSYAG